MNQADQKKIAFSACKRAMLNHPSFWSSRLGDLNNLISLILSEIASFETASSLPLSFTGRETENILAVWGISGSGSLTKDFINSPSDDKYKDKEWYGGTDRTRLRYCGQVIFSIAEAKSGRKVQSFEEKVQLIREHGPYLIYNGIPEQIKVLLEESEKTFVVPKEKIYVPVGKVIKTLDQIKNFSMPSSISDKKGELIIVSHSAHLSRILRFMKKYEDNFHGLMVKVLPISVGGFSDFVEAEISGILDYVAMGESEYEPINYSC